MTLATPALHEGTLSARRRAGSVIVDLLTVVAIGVCIPFVILALGTPVALCVRLVLWIVGLSG